MDGRQLSGTGRKVRIRFSGKNPRGIRSCGKALTSFRRPEILPLDRLPAVPFPGPRRVVFRHSVFPAPEARCETVRPAPKTAAADSPRGITMRPALRYDYPLVLQTAFPLSVKQGDMSFFLNYGFHPSVVYVYAAAFLIGLRILNKQPGFPFFGNEDIIGIKGSAGEQAGDSVSLVPMDSIGRSV